MSKYDGKTETPCPDYSDDNSHDSSHGQFISPISTVTSPDRLKFLQRVSETGRVLDWVKLLEAFSDVPESCQQYCKVIHPEDISFSFALQNGKGISGSVFKATLERDVGTYNAGSTVACKVLHDTVQQCAVSKEAEALRQLKVLADHPNVIDLIGVNVTERPYFIVTEYLSVSLRDVLEKEGGQPLDVVANWMQQIASGLEHIHSANIIHRDLKSPNILFQNGHSSLPKDQRKLKIIDFGLARDCLLNNGPLKLGVGTQRWMAPEVIPSHEPPSSSATDFSSLARSPRTSSNISAKMDIFSLGMIMYEMLSGHLPYEVLGGVRANAKISQGFRPTLNQIRMPLLMEYTIRLCWNHDPDRRPILKLLIQLLEEAGKFVNESTLSMTEQVLISQFQGCSACGQSICINRTNEFQVSRSRSAPQVGKKGAVSRNRSVSVDLNKSEQRDLSVHAGNVGNLAVRSHHSEYDLSKIQRRLSSYEKKPEPRFEMSPVKQSKPMHKVLSKSFLKKLSEGNDKKSQDMIPCNVCKVEGLHIGQAVELLRLRKSQEESMAVIHDVVKASSKGFFGRFIAKMKRSSTTSKLG